MLAAGHAEMAGQPDLGGEPLHDRQRRLLQPAGRRMLGAELEQPQRQAVFAGLGVTGDIAAPLQHAEHAEDLADRPADSRRQRLLVDAAGLGRQRLQQVQPLLQRRGAGPGAIPVVGVDILARMVFHI
jgi:hypothetical protein